jgi:hypothetical protein
MPLALDDLVGRMLKRDPEQRATLGTVAADVSAFLTAGEMLATVNERPSARIPAVTGDERRLVAVIVCDTGVLADARDEARSPAADTVPARPEASRRSSGSSAASSSPSRAGRPS